MLIVLPFGLMIITVTFWLIIKCIIRVFKETYYKNAVVMVWINLYMVFPVIVAAGYSIVDCQNIAGGYYLRMDYTY